jgi:hypothetical protein
VGQGVWREPGSMARTPDGRQAAQAAQAGSWRRLPLRTELGPPRLRLRRVGLLALRPRHPVPRPELLLELPPRRGRGLGHLRRCTLLRLCCLLAQRPRDLLLVRRALRCDRLLCLRACRGDRLLRLQPRLCERLLVGRVCLPPHPHRPRHSSTRCQLSGACRLSGACQLSGSAVQCSEGAVRQHPCRRMGYPAPSQLPLSLSLSVCVGEARRLLAAPTKHKSRAVITNRH